MKKHYIIEAAEAILNARKDRSAWDKAVTIDALELLDTVQEAVTETIKKYTETEEGGNAHALELLKDRQAIKAAMLNGTNDWSQYSWGGFGLCYDVDISEHYCTPSELKKTRNGERRPNSREEWLDVQARALSQASIRAQAAIKSAIKRQYTINDNNTWGHE